MAQGVAHAREKRSGAATGAGEGGEESDPRASTLLVLDGIHGEGRVPDEVTRAIASLHERSKAEHLRLLISSRSPIRLDSAVPIGLSK